MSAFERALYAIEIPRAKDIVRPGGSFWRKEEPILEEGSHHIKVGGMFGHQREWWALENEIKVLVGGLGAGKTLLGGKRVISLALENAPCPVMAISPSFPMARKTTIPTIAALLQGKQQLLGRRRLYFRFNKQSLEFDIRYKGRDAKIYIGSGEDPDSLRGSNLAGGWIDEPFIQDFWVFLHLRARIRHPDARHKELLLTGTPEQLNWGYDLCVGELEEKHDVGVVFASTRANKALDPKYVQGLEASLDDRQAAAYIDAQFINLSKGQVYYAFDPKENVVSLERPQGSQLGAGMDFNVNPMASAVFWKLGEHLHFFKEYELPNSDTEYMCQHLSEKHPGLSLIYPDASGNARHSASPGGKSDFTYIRAAGFEIEAHHENPRRKDRYNAVNGRLKARDGRVRLTVDPKCKTLIRYLSTYTHELITKPEQKAMSHLLDAFSYPIAYLFPVDKHSLAARLTGT